MNRFVFGKTNRFTIQAFQVSPEIQIFSL
ncbi:hypothetical protein EZS27_028487, partial [termite gut metagenome]